MASGVSITKTNTLANACCRSELAREELIGALCIQDAHVFVDGFCVEQGSDLFP